MLLKRVLTFLSSLVLACAFFSCSPAVYITKTPVVPLFKQKGDLHIEQGASIAQISNNGQVGIGLKGAYALSDKIAVAGNVYHNSSSVTVDSMYSSGRGIFSFGPNWGISHNSVNISVGRYWSGKAEHEKNWRAEVFSGFGYSSLRNQREDGSFFNTNYFNYFIRPAVGYISENFDCYFSLKMNYADYLSSSWKLYNRNFPFSTSPEDLSKNRLVFEPTIGFRLGIDPVKLTFNYTWGSFNEQISISERDDTPITANKMITLSTVIFITKKSE